VRLEIQKIVENTAIFGGNPYGRPQPSTATPGSTHGGLEGPGGWAR